MIFLSFSLFFLCPIGPSLSKRLLPNFSPSLKFEGFLGVSPASCDFFYCFELECCSQDSFAQLVLFCELSTSSGYHLNHLSSHTVLGMIYKATSDFDSNFCYYCYFFLLYHSHPPNFGLLTHCLHRIEVVDCYGAINRLITKINQIHCQLLGLTSVCYNHSMLFFICKVSEQKYPRLHEPFKVV